MAINPIPRIRAVYAISHAERHYVGGSSNVQKRWQNHRSDLRNGKHKNAGLQAAWDATGGVGLVFTTLETVPVQDTLLSREQHWIDYLGAAVDGFNVAPRAGNSTGCVTSPETAAKISRSLSGRVLSDEHKARIAKGVSEHAARARATRERIRLAMAAKRPGRGGPKILSDDDVLAIRAKVAAGETLRSVAKAFSTTKGNISLIYHRKRRASVS